jgi:hypothetical protein
MEKIGTINAVEMVRGIRDAFYAQLKDKTPEERLAFYRGEGVKAHAALQELARSKALAVEDDARL